ncbi:MAG: histidine kinase, partial [Pseudomonadales bacterium]|nr:histidine kinase [Pseudomonadales bacterium]
MKLRLLIVDDSEDDVFLLVRTLKTGGIELEYRHVETALELMQALKSSSWDLVITDHNMVGFTSKEAL